MASTIGFRTTIQRFPDDKLTIIVLANRTDINPEELALKVADLYLGSEAVDGLCRDSRPQLSAARSAARMPELHKRKETLPAASLRRSFDCAKP